MSETRWKSELFAVSLDVRQLCNEPAQLTLVRRGVYLLDPHKSLHESMIKVHRAHPDELVGVAMFNRTVGEPVGRFLQTKKFDFQRGPPVDLLGRGEMEAIRAYTVDRPDYYSVFNKLLYDSQNGQHDCCLNVWQEYLCQFDRGLTKLQAYQDKTRTSQATVRRVAWVPPEHVDAYYQVNSDIVLKGATSTTTSDSVLRRFYNQGLGTGKRCLLLELDPVASREAVDIRFLSFYNEEEWLLPPFFRARVVSRDTYDGFGGPEPVLVLRLAGLRRLPALTQVLDWHSGLGVGNLMGLAVMLAAHGAADLATAQPWQQSLTNSLLVCENLLCGLHGVRSFFLERIICGVKLAWCSFCRIFQVDQTDLVNSTQEELARIDDEEQKIEEERQEQQMPMVQAASARWLQLLQSELPHIATRSQQDSAWIWRQIQWNLKAMQQDFVTGSAVEGRAIQQLVTMLVETSVAEMLFLNTGCHTDLRHSAFSWLPPVLPESRWLQSYHPPGAAAGTQFLHPVLASIAGSNALLEFDPTAGSTPKPLDMHFLAQLDLLRLRLSRTRIVLPLGEPDSGKSTILNHTFGLRLPVGLREAGRTKFLSFHQPPIADLDSSELLVGDLPGFGDRVRERDDIMRVVCQFAFSKELRDMMLLLCVLKSGRDLPGPLEAFAAELSTVDCHVLVVVTHADERFVKMYTEMLQEHTEHGDDVGMELSAEEESSLFRQCAECIKYEDRQRIETLMKGRAPRIVYTCFYGQLACREAPPRRGEGPPCLQGLPEGFHQNFQDVLRKPLELRQEILNHFGVFRD